MDTKNLRQYLKPRGFGKLMSGHPWLLKNYFQKNFEFPVSVGIYPLGEHWFLYSPQSEICFRRLGPAERFWPDLKTVREPILNLNDFEKIFYEPLLKHFIRTFEAKKKLLNNELCFRWLFSENDFIPGLTADIFKNTLVVQLQTAPVEFFWPQLKKILFDTLSNATKKDASCFKILEQRHHSVRKKEGLPIIEPESTEKIIVPWNGLKWKFSPASSQKTGAYLDQHDNHLKTLHWAQKMEVKEAWDLCCFEGGFGLHLAKAGIKVTAVDLSSEALLAAKENAELNNIPAQNFETVKQDVFYFLTDKFARAEKTGLIILDPPSFTKRASKVNRALKGYRDLNLRAMHCLKPGGLLVTCSCSHHIDRESFFYMLQEAAHDARRSVRVLEVCGPSVDHAPVISFPEASYLQTWFLSIT